MAEEHEISKIYSKIYSSSMAIENESLRIRMGGKPIEYDTKHAVQDSLPAQESDVDMEMAEDEEEEGHEGEREGQGWEERPTRTIHVHLPSCLSPFSNSYDDEGIIEVIQEQEKEKESSSEEEDAHAEEVVGEDDEDWESPFCSVVMEEEEVEEEEEEEEIINGIETIGSAQRSDPEEMRRFFYEISDGGYAKIIFDKEEEEEEEEGEEEEETDEIKEEIAQLTAQQDSLEEMSEEWPRIKSDTGSRFEHFDTRKGDEKRLEQKTVLGSNFGAFSATRITIGQNDGAAALPVKQTTPRFEVFGAKSMVGPRSLSDIDSLSVRNGGFSGSRLGGPGGGRQGVESRLRIGIEKQELKARRWVGKKLTHKASSAAPSRQGHYAAPAPLYPAIQRAKRDPAYSPLRTTVPRTGSTHSPVSTVSSGGTKWPMQRRSRALLGS
jgi:hypothetical protein